MNTGTTFAGMKEASALLIWHFARQSLASCADVCSTADVYSDHPLGPQQGGFDNCATGMAGLI